MAKWKDNKTDSEVVEQILRSYLIRCHRLVSKEYPEIAGMDPTKAADYLLHLRRTGRIEIKLYNKTSTLIGCKITELDSPERASQQSGAEAAEKSR